MQRTINFYAEKTVGCHEYMANNDAMYHSMIASGALCVRTASASQQTLHLHTVDHGNASIGDAVTMPLNATAH